ncbi:MAG: dienelactone hydrolase family protein [Spirochaetaceae bacterium]|nr:dienelactone hydrolase family protein [Myxococcales bacterium]MCB9722525.1 dienelactone hydrolase family protein [Spirochaetaceae bacterium]HPG24200.1 dienelactone hydrolase family protein [Myxococcota bacterium]
MTSDSERETEASHRSGREITVPSDDGDFVAYLAVPAEGHGPGILVLQEWWGLVPEIRDVCDRLARAGFVALAPDLYRGDATRDPDEAARLMMGLEIERAGRDLEQAAATLQRRPETDGTRLGCIGFCMGGRLALEAAGRVPAIGAVVDCYGVHPKVDPDFAACRAKVLGVFAENDEFVSKADVAALADALRSAGVVHRFRTYLGVRHAFLNEARPEVFDPGMAAEAWRDVLTFLDAELR